MMECAINAPLQNRPDAFDAVGRNVVADKFASTVVDGFMREARSAQTAIAAMLICVQRRSRLHARFDFGLNGVGIGATDGHCLGSSAALPHAENCRLADSATSSVKFL